jgi:hypothetical protein
LEEGGCGFIKVCVFLVVRMSKKKRILELRKRIKFLAGELNREKANLSYYLKEAESRTCHRCGGKCEGYLCSACHRQKKYYRVGRARARRKKSNY